MSVNRRLETVEGRKLQLTEKPLPATPPQGLIVKIHYAGICHSDLHFWQNTLSLSDDLSLNAVDVLGVKFPFVLGHEISGEVHELGTESCDGDIELTVGDKVIIYPWIAGCEPVCDACKLGQQLRCSSKNTLEAFIGLKLDGGWQTFVAVPKRYMVVKVPDGIGLDVACLTACSGITAYNAVYRIKDHIESVTKNCGSSSVIIHGVGGVGLWAVSVAKALLPASTNILAMDVAANKLETAKKLGAKETLLVNTAADDTEFIAPVLQATAGGADAILDFVGLGSAANRLVNCLSKGGWLVLIGLAGGTLHLSTFSTVLTRKTISNSLVGDKCQLISVLQLLSDNKIHSPPIEYCKLDAHDVSEVLHRMENRKLDGRVIIKVVE